MIHDKIEDVNGSELTGASKDWPDFNVGASEVIQQFGRTVGKVEYIGTDTADFQAQPFIYDKVGKPIILSDWEMHVKREVNAGRQHPEDFPHFLDDPKLYIKRAEELRLNMFRFSLDFARLCPEEGEFDEARMAQYVKALALVKAHGMEPMLCIYHWPMPKYLLDIDDKGEIRAGGWENPDVQKHFRFYVEKVVEYLGDENKIRPTLAEVGFNQEDQDRIAGEGLTQYFLTINEPTAILYAGHIIGTFPPYEKLQVRSAIKVLEQLSIAHQTAQEELRELGKPEGAKQPIVGATHNWAKVEGPLGSGRLVNEVMNYYVTRYMEKKAQSDFMNLQHYHRLKFPLIHGKSGGRVYGDMPDFGDMYMPGIYDVLKEMNRQYPDKPIMITETGSCDKTGLLSPYWAIEIARHAMQAAQEGVPLRGINQWTLVNNYEWALGMDVPFGMFSERELSQPLISSQEGSIRSWEVWKAIADVYRPQDEESVQRHLIELQRVHGVAEAQFMEEVERRRKH
jgi:beta-glucosidase